MQFVLLIYQGSTPLPGTEAWSALSEAEQKAIYADYAELNRAPGVTPGLPLGELEQARTVTVEDGKPHIVEGPFRDAGGAVGGYAVVETDSIERAAEIAARIPAARHGGGVEIRPVGTYW